MYYQVCELKGKYNDMLDPFGWKDVPDGGTEKNIRKTQDSEGNSATRKEKIKNKGIWSLFLE